MPKTRQDTSAGEAQQITPELVQRVADQVYALWLRELKLEQERLRRNDKSTPLVRRQGRW